MKDAFNPNSFFLLSLLVQGAALSILRFIAQKNRHLLKRGSADFQVGREVTGRVNPASISFLVAGCQSREASSHCYRFSNSASTYLGTAHSVTRIQHVRYDRFVYKNRRVLLAGVCWFSRTAAKLSTISVDEGKRVLWNKEKTPLGNEVDWLAQVFMVLSKRVVGAFQKNRRF